jgi:hypothetical protein
VTSQSEQAYREFHGFTFRSEPATPAGPNVLDAAVIQAALGVLPPTCELESLKRNEGPLESWDGAVSGQLWVILRMRESRGGSAKRCFQGEGAAWVGAMARPRRQARAQRNPWSRRTRRCAADHGLESQCGRFTTEDTESTENSERV